MFNKATIHKLTTVLYPLTDVIKSAKVSARIAFLDKPIIKRFVPISLSLLVIILLSSSSSISAYLTIGPSIW